MKKTILLYSVVIAAAALALSWLDYRHAVRSFSTEVYLTTIAAAFLALGIWVGYRLSHRGAGGSFEVNRQALDYLGITGREHKVLELLARGLANKEIADRLSVPANRVKTHLASLYAKLEVSRRTQAVLKAKELRLVR